MSFIHETNDSELHEINQLIEMYDREYGKEDMIEDAKNKASQIKDQVKEKAKEKVSEIKEKAKEKGAEIQQKLIKTIKRVIDKLLEETSFAVRLEKNKDEHLKKCTALAASIKNSFPEATKNKVTLSSKFNMTALKDLIASDNKIITGGAETLNKVDEFLKAYAKSVESGDIASLDAKKAEIKKLMDEMENPEIKKLKSNITSKESINLVDNGIVTEHGRALEEMCNEITTKKLIETISSCVNKIRGFKNIVNQLDVKPKSGSEKNTDDVATFNKAQTAVLQLIFKTLNTTVNLPVDCYKAITTTADMVVNKASKGNKNDKELKQKAEENYMYVLEFDKEFLLIENQLQESFKKFENPSTPMCGFEELYVSMPNDTTPPEILAGLESIIGNILSAIGKFFASIFNFFVKIFTGKDSDEEPSKTVEQTQQKLEDANKNIAEISEQKKIIQEDENQYIKKEEETPSEKETVEETPSEKETVEETPSKVNRAIVKVIVDEYFKGRDDVNKDIKKAKMKPYQVNIDIAILIELYGAYVDRYEHSSHVVTLLSNAISELDSFCKTQTKILGKKHANAKTALDKFKTIESWLKDINTSMSKSKRDKRISELSKKLKTESPQVLIDDDGNFTEKCQTNFFKNSKLLKSIKTCEREITRSRHMFIPIEKQLQNLQKSSEEYIKEFQKYYKNYKFKSPEKRNKHLEDTTQLRKTASSIVSTIKTTRDSVVLFIIDPKKSFNLLKTIANEIDKRIKQTDIIEESKKSGAIAKFKELREKFLSLPSQILARYKK